MKTKLQLETQPELSTRQSSFRSLLSVLCGMTVGLALLATAGPAGAQSDNANDQASKSAPATPAAPVAPAAGGGGYGGGGGGGGGSGGGGGGGGGGGHTETAGNNLSVPAIWVDGPGLAVPGTMLQASVTVPWATQVNGYWAYAQKVEGNVWQAQNVTAPVGAPVNVNEIDWGDMLESSPLKVGTPIRIELALYKTDVVMSGFEMVMLANPSSPDEVQGVISLDKGSPTLPVTAGQLVGKLGEATIYTAKGKLVVQKLIGLREEVLEGDLLWDGTKWIDANANDPSGVEAPQTPTFGAEINVGGKVIYGLSKGGWKASQAGDYRITFYLGSSDVKITALTTIRVPVEETVVAAEEGVGATAKTDPVNNLTYIDVRVAAAGGGGGRKK
jgi:hypothetical protein